MTKPEGLSRVAVEDGNFRLFVCGVFVWQFPSPNLPAFEKAMRDVSGEIDTAISAAVALRVQEAVKEGAEMCAKLAEAGMLNVGTQTARDLWVVRKTRDEIAAAIRALSAIRTPEAGK